MASYQAEAKKNLSPLRKSINPHNPQNASVGVLSENDDDAERLARRRDLSTTTKALTTLQRNDRRHSLGLSFLAQVPAPQIVDRISECIKLSAENKINIKNAFGLEMIDFMTYMVKKQDSKMSNLQVASTSLDVSTKIYGFRVDGVYTEILKMMSDADKQDKQDGETADGEINNTQADEGNLAGRHDKKKRKRNKQKIFNGIDSLKGSIETARPSLVLMGDGDLQTTDALCQVMLPNHANSGFYLHQYNDVLVDVIEKNKTSKDAMEVDAPNVPDFSQLHLCPPLHDFEFNGWNSDNESEENQAEEPAKNDDGRFQFDLDASLPADDEPPRASMDYFDMESDGENVNQCMQAPNQVEKIVDLRHVVTKTESLNAPEYSFFQKSIGGHWAGPSHWKLRNLERLFGGSRVVEACPQGAPRKRKEMVLVYDDNAKQAVLAKFAQSNNVKFQSNKTKQDWKEEIQILPRDMHYDISSVNDLYLHKLITIKFDDYNQLDASHMSDVMDGYDYNNENDTSNYCPNVVNDDYGEGDEVGNGNDGELDTQVIFTGENLVAIPKLANKISIAYSLRAKRIDMRQLKKSIWNSLISINDNENLNIQEAVQQETGKKMTATKSFSEIYKTLPNMLTKTNAEALSFPISFISLLHLANEKSLKVQSSPDMTEIIVEGN